MSAEKLSNFSWPRKDIIHDPDSQARGVPEKIALFAVSTKYEKLDDGSHTRASLRGFSPRTWVKKFLRTLRLNLQYAKA